MGASRAKLFGKYRGVVKNNVDKQNLGRLQIECTKILQGHKLPWALPSFPYAAPKDKEKAKSVPVGLVFIPPIGANVWVEFEGGNIDVPIWSGCFYPEAGAPSFPAGNKGDKSHSIQTNGMTLLISDEAGVSMTIDKDKKKLEMIYTNGKITMKSSAASVEITGDSIKLNMGGKGVTVKSGEIKLENGDTKIISKTLLKGATTVNGAATIKGATKIDNTLEVSKATKLKDTLDVKNKTLEVS